MDEHCLCELTVTVGGVRGCRFGGQELAPAQQLVLDDRPLVEELTPQDSSLVLQK